MNFLKDVFTHLRLSIFLIHKILFQTRRKQSIAAILSMALGILPIILVQEVAIGMIEGMSGRIIETSLYHVNAHRQTPVINEDIDGILQELQQDPRVEGAYLELNTAVVIQNEKKRAFAMLRGIDEALITTDTPFSRYMDVVDGEIILTSSELPAVMIAQSLAEELETQVGDSLHVISVNTARGSSIPRISRAVVRGIFTTGLAQLEQNWILASHDGFSRAFPPRNTTYTIGVNVEDPFAIQNNLIPTVIPDRARLAKQREYQLLQEKIERDLSSQWRVATWNDLGATRFSRLRQTRGTLIVLMACILIVSVITIAAFLLRITTELAQQFSIVRLLGMSSDNLKLSMVYFALLCGICSIVLSFSITLVLLTFINEILTGIGVLTSVIMPNNENILTASAEFYLDSIPVTISGFRLFIVCFSVCILTMISGLYSAKKLVKISNTKSLQL